MSGFDEISASKLERFFPGDSELAHLMRDLDWSKTDLGQPENWPENLRVAVSLCLTSRIPVVMYWGANFTVLYNDPYISFLGETKHPRYLGQPGQDCWREIWDTIGPMLNGVYETAQATWSEDLQMFFARRLPLEEVYVRFTFGPVLAPDGRTVEGIFCPCTETTEQVVGARRLETLRKLSIQASEARSVESACREAAEVLAENPLDIPFAAIYIVDATGSQAKMIASSGLPESHTLPLSASLSQQDKSLYPLASVFQTYRPEAICDPSIGESLILPITGAASQKVTGLVVLGISPRRVWDAAYRTFFDLVANHIGTAIADAQAYEAERQRAEALAELDRAKTAFFSNVSHEFRTPLTLMLSPLEDLLNTLDGRLKPDERGQLELIQRNGLRLQKLVNTLLDFARIEAGRVQASYQPTDLATYTTELASLFRSLIEQAEMRLVIDCPPLPEPVYVDRQMWEKIVLNLISNAFKFTFAGSISIRLQPVNNFVQLTVADTGVGIARDQLPRLFERFYRINGTQSRSYEGSGIGLALVQELVKLHGGTIEVTSQLGEGTTFTIVIPLGSAHLPSDRIAATRTEVSTTTGARAYLEEAQQWQPNDSQHERLIDSVPVFSSPSVLKIALILVVDDNADMRGYIQRLLSQYWEVETASDGIEAKKVIDKHLPDLVLTDVMMPRLDGFGLLRELRSNPRTQDIPIILLSARAGEESRVEGLEAGADDYLIKPFSARELLARVEANLKLAQLRQATAQKEQELRREAQTAKDTLENVLNRIGDQFFALDREWRYIYVNDRVVEVTGIKKENLLGRNIWDLFPEILNSQFYTEVQRAVVKQTSVQFQYFYPRWNRWFENRVYPSADGVSFIVTEITVRKQAEAALQQRETELTLITNSVPVLISFIDKNQRYRFVSQKYEEWFGVSLPEINDKFLWEVLGEAAYQVIRPYVERVLAGEEVTFEMQIPYEVVGMRYVQATYVPRINSMGTVEGFVALVSDINTRKQAEDALRQSEERFRNMADNAPVMVWVTDATGNCTYLSQSWYNFTGQTEETGLGFGWFEAVHPEDLEPCKNTFLTANARREAFRFEYRLRGKTGEYRWAIDTASPWFGVNGEFKGFIGSVVDITERKQAEAEREELLTREQIARETAEAANRVKDEFLAILSHELRSPLNPILGWSKLLQTSNLDEATTKKALTTIERNAKLQAELIEDLLDVSRILRGKLTLNITPINLALTISAAIETVRLAAQAKSIKIETLLESNVGLVSGDSTRLQQVVWNLLSNAVKFTSPKGRVQVVLEEIGTHAQITVTDTGKGISADFLPYIFDYFRQADSATNRRFGGLGLGLAIVRHLVELHGGTIQAESQGEGQGATFKVKLPLMLTQAKSDQKPNLPDNNLNLKGVKILVVDDDVDTRDFMTFLLEQAGATVSASACATEALTHLKQFPRDILLSDIGMPEIDGYMLMRQIRSLPPELGGQIKAIALTAYAQEFDQQQALSVGFDKHISKPVEPMTLIAAIADLLKC